MFGGALEIALSFTMQFLRTVPLASNVLLSYGCNPWKRLKYVTIRQCFHNSFQWGLVRPSENAGA